MIDVSNLSSSFSSYAPLVALGGVVAAVAAGWRHVQGWLQTVKRLVIVEADLDHYTAEALQLFLIAKWKRAPSGKLTTAALRFPIREADHYYTVPFHVENEDFIAYRGRQFVWAKRGNSNRHIHKISAVRGLVNVRELLVEATRFFNEDYLPSIKSRNRSSRFAVYDLIGTDKSNAMGEMASAFRNKSLSGESELSTSDAVSNFQPVLALEKSFVYKPEKYMPSPEDSPLTGLYYPEYILEQFEQARQWMAMGDWYLERSIPHRRGWLFHGPGGTGKSSLAKAIAKDLKIPIYRYFLNTMSDQEFMNEWRGMMSPCVALFEDFDNTFHGREPATEHRSLSFDTVLNMISGVNTMSGVLLIVTTNHIEHIDPALGTLGPDGKSTRPGRIDRIVYIAHMAAAERERMAKDILRDWPDLIERALDPARYTTDPTPTQFQEDCLQLAYERMKD